MTAIVRARLDLLENMLYMFLFMQSSRYLLNPTAATELSEQIIVMMLIDDVYRQYVVSNVSPSPTTKCYCNGK